MGDAVTTSVAAELLGVSPQRVRQLKKQLGGYLADGRTLVYPRANVEALVAKWKREGKPKPGRKAGAKAARAGRKS